MLFLLPTVLVGQDDLSPCQKDPAYRQLAFRLGKWDVHDADGKRIGVQLFETALDGCLNLETWEAQAGRTGMGFTFFDRTLKKWRRVYVDDQGNTTEGVAEPSDEGVLAFESTGSSGARIRWSLVSESKRRLHSITERSRDDGKTWKIISTLTLERAD